MMRIFITNKPHILKCLKETLIKDGDIGIINVENAYQFDYNNFEFLTCPHYQMYDYFFYKIVTMDKNDLVYGENFDKSKDTYTDIFIKASELVIVSEVDHRSIRAIDLFQHFFFNSQYEMPITFATPLTYRNKDIEDSFLSRTAYKNHKSSIEHREAYKVKDFIDYNFNGCIQRGNFDAPFITRNMIHTLLLMLNEHTDTEQSFYVMLDKKNVGSAMSRSMILQRLKEKNFISKHWGLTESSVSFIEKISHEMRDIKNYEFLLQLPYMKLNYDDKIRIATQHLKILFK